MKKLLLITLLMSGLHAETICDGISSFARTVYGARQDGVKMSKVIKFTKNPIFRKIIISAYEQPKFYTDEIKAEQEKEFGNMWYLECAKSCPECVDMEEGATKK